MKKIIPLLIPIILLIIGLYFGILKIYGTDFSKVPGDFGDARFNNYILEHDYLYFIGKVNKYWDAPFMYPFKNVIAFSDNLLGTAPIYSIFRCMNGDRETSFQLWLLTLFILNFTCCYFVLRKWSKNNVLSSVGAYVYAFSIFIVGNIYNVQTFPRFIIPFVFYWFWKYLSEKNIKYFLFFCLGIVFQFYCGIYLGFILLYTLIFFFVSYIIIYKDVLLFSQLKNPKIIIQHFIVLSISGATFFPLIFPYLLSSHQTGIATFNEVLSSVPSLRSYFFTSNAAQSWECLSKHGLSAFKNWWCHFLFIGALPWLGIAAVPFVLYTKKMEKTEKKFLRFLILSLFFSFIFCLNINGFSLYKYIYNIPGFSVMRSLNRLINVEVFFFILILVFTFNELSKKNKSIRWIVAFFPLIIIIDNRIDPDKVMTYDKWKSKERIAVVRNEISNHYNPKYKAIVCIEDNVIDVVSFHLDVMLAAQELNVPCVNSYTGHNPNEYNDFFNKIDKKSVLIWYKFNNIDTLVVQTIKLINHN